MILMTVPSSKGKANDCGRRPMARPVVPKPTRGEVFFAVTLFVSAALLFVVQPMFAKMVLPLLGGAPAVWNTCLVFYQAALLAGYLYAPLVAEVAGTAAAGGLAPGVALSAVDSCCRSAWPKVGCRRPTPSRSLGCGCCCRSRWACRFWWSRPPRRCSRRGSARREAGPARDPYFLYAASNLGSLLALLSYPLVIESQWTLREQAWGWAAGYGAVDGCWWPAVRCSCGDRRLPAAAASTDAVGWERIGRRNRLPSVPTLRRRLHWLALSLVPSSLLLGVTTYISTDIAAIPLLWVLPLALYLLTFVLVFARRPILPLPWMLRTQPYLIVAAAGALAWRTDMPSATVVDRIASASGVFRHRHGMPRPACRRPARGSRLTEFYLWMSLGGVLGGLFNALVAPLVFSGAVEYPLMMAAACLLRPPAAAPLRGAAGVGAAVPVARGGFAGLRRADLDSAVAGRADGMGIRRSAGNQAGCWWRRPPWRRFFCAAARCRSAWELRPCWP